MCENQSYLQLSKFHFEYVWLITFGGKKQTLEKEKKTSLT